MVMIIKPFSHFGVWFNPEKGYLPGKQVGSEFKCKNGADQRIILEKRIMIITFYCIAQEIVD